MTEQSYMSKNYAQVMKQISALQSQAEKLRKQEVDGVIERIREAIAHYQLTAADLGLGAARAPRTAAAPVKRGRKPGKAKVVTVVKYRDEAGNTWVGRGKRPQWLRDALAGGKTLQDFAVN